MSVLYCLPRFLTNLIYVVMICNPRMRLNAQPSVPTVLCGDELDSQLIDNQDLCNASLNPVTVTIQAPAPTAVSACDRARTKKSRDMTKPTKGVCAQRRLRSAWASAQSDQSSLCAQWVAKDPSFLHADSEDSDRTGRMPRLI